MREVATVVFGLAVWAAAPSSSAAEIGLPTDTFVRSWTALPAGRFTPDETRRPSEAATASVTSLPDGELASMLDDAFASARNVAERRDITLSEMMAPWDQDRRTMFQHLRDAEAAYAGADGARNDRFVATLDRVVDGTGRSAAVDGSASADLDKAFAAALARQGEGARGATQARQQAWRAYRDAFAAFADLLAPGSAAGVTSELERQRTSELVASQR